MIIDTTISAMEKKVMEAPRSEVQHHFDSVYNDESGWTNLTLSSQNTGFYVVVDGATGDIGVTWSSSGDSHELTLEQL